MYRNDKSYLIRRIVFITAVLCAVAVLCCSSSEAEPLESSLVKTLTSNQQTSLPQYLASGKITPGSGLRGANQKPCMSSMGSAHPDQGSGNCTGNLYFEVSLPTADLSLHYNSHSQLDFGFGPGFSLSLDSRFVILTGYAPGMALLLQGDGTTIPFHLENGKWSTNDPRIDQSYLVVSGSTAIQSYPDGIVVKYSAVPGDGSQFGIASTTDRYGNQTTFTRNTKGQLTKITNQYARSVTITYGAHAETITDVAGSNYILSYSGNLLTRVVQPDKRDWTFAYTADKQRIATSKNSDGETLQYSYYPSGDLESIRNDLGYYTYLYYSATTVVLATSFDLDEEKFNTSGALLSSTHNDIGTFYQRDSNNRVIKLTDAQGTVTTFGYDSKDPLVASSSTSNGGAQVVYERNSNRNLIKTVVTQRATKTETLYNDKLYGLISTITEGAAGEEQTLFIRDNIGNLKEVRHNGQTEASYTYYPNGQMQTQSSGTGMKTTYTYSPSGHVATITDHFGRVTEFTRNALGNVIETKTPTMIYQQAFNVMGEEEGLSSAKARAGAGGVIEANTSSTYLTSGAPSMEKFSTSVSGAMQMSREVTYDAGIPGNVKSDVLINAEGGRYELGR